MTRSIVWTMVLCFGAMLAGWAQGTSAAGNQTSSPQDETLIANSKALREAQLRKDVEYLKGALTDDFLQVGSEGKLHKKKDFLGDAEDGNLKEFMLYNPLVAPVDENAAIVTYDCVIKMPEGDAPNLAPRYQHISDLWVKQGGQWRLRFEQATASRPVD